VYTLLNSFDAIITLLLYTFLEAARVVAWERFIRPSGLPAVDSLIEPIKLSEFGVCIVKTRKKESISAELKYS
jgi:hypothetical protein